LRGRIGTKFLVPPPWQQNVFFYVSDILEETVEETLIFIEWKKWKQMPGLIWPDGMCEAVYFAFFN